MKRFAVITGLTVFALLSLAAFVGMATGGAVFPDRDISFEVYPAHKKRK